ncbi:conjugal transfer protein TraG N-terminal domain-containing protein [Campylobacter sp. MOP7]|uniref:conjugal transfer protein TraG N-terminal domain-containing protein n=1 Tax=Campylobacter canis TaxID=3378588 RepID=UPI00387ED1B1
MRYIYLLVGLLPALLLGADDKVYTFYVDSPTMVEAYYNIFNSMASMFQAGTYMEILKLTVLVGGFVTFALAVLKTYQGGAGTAPLGEFAKYLLIMTALLTLLFANPVNMYIKTKKLPEFCAPGSSATAHYSIADSGIYKNASADTVATMVGNIPEALAWVFATINEVGRGTTNMATSVFGNVDKSGIATGRDGEYASYLSVITSLLSTRIPDLLADNRFMGTAGGTSTGVAGKNTNTLLNGLDSIQRDCIMYQASKSIAGNVVIDAFSTTGDMYATLDDFITKGELAVYKNPMPTDLKPGPGGTLPARSDKKVMMPAGYMFNGGIAPKDALVSVNGEVLTCGKLWTNVKDGLDTLKASGAIECQVSLRGKLDINSMMVLTGDNDLKTHTTNVTAYARNIGINAGLMNRFLESKNKIVPGEMSYAAGKSIGDFVTSSLGNGYYMAKMLPYMQMGMRAIFYAFFPFVFIVVLLPGGVKNLGQYLKTLIWIELWSPTAAILNMFLSLQSQQAMSNLYNVQGLNPANSLQVFSEATQMASVAGYLYAMVPALTWLILTGSGYMLGNITGAVAARMAQNMDSRAINQDMRSLTALGAVNAERRAKGQELINLAELDKMQAERMAAMETGQLSAYTHLGHAATIAGTRGREIFSTAEGVGQNEASRNQANIDAAKTMALTTAGVNREKAIQAGLMNQDGTFNMAGIDKFARTKGVEELVKYLGEQNVQKLYSPQQRAELEGMKLAKTMGETLGSKERLVQELRAIGGHEGLISRIQAGDNRAFARGLIAAAPHGAYASMWNKLSDDQKVSILEAGGISYSDWAKYGVSTSFAEMKGAERSVEAFSLSGTGRGLVGWGTMQARQENLISDGDIRRALNIQNPNITSQQLTESLRAKVDEINRINDNDTASRSMQALVRDLSGANNVGVKNINDYASKNVENYLKSTQGASTLDAYQHMTDHGISVHDALTAQDFLRPVQSYAEMQNFRALTGDDLRDVVSVLRLQHGGQLGNAAINISRGAKDFLMGIAGYIKDPKFTNAISKFTTK